jgi:hypothetical protein
MRVCRIVIVLLCALQAGVCFGDSPYSEDAVKAAFLFRFTGYVEWPPQSLSGDRFTIAVLDDDQVAANLMTLVEGKQIHKLPVHIAVVHGLHDLGNAQMLFVGAGDTLLHRRVVAAAAGRPILVVTDDAQGIEEGSTVNFMMLDRRVRFEISLGAAERSGLTISSELLSVAARVHGRLRSDVNCAPARDAVPYRPGCPLGLAGL